MAGRMLLQRPIFGGLFGRGRYTLASVAAISRGLHTLKFMVLEPRIGAVLAIADDKCAALSAARQLLAAANDMHFAEQGVAANDAQPYLWPADELPLTPQPAPAISRRRQAIFDRCAGRCHYCAADLQHDGAWHVEHMLPRALGGSDDAMNLVAACVNCNLQKGDRTAVEFLTAELD